MTNLYRASAEAFSDAYKVGMSMLHELQIEDFEVSIANSYSNFTPRKNCFMNFCEQSDGHLVVFGTRDSFQAIVALWNKTFFSKSERKVMKRLKKRTKHVFGSLAEHEKFLTDMRKLHQLGYLPIEVRSIDEGTKYPIGLPVFTVKATIDGFGWLVNYLETVSSGEIWPMINTATKVEQFYLQAKHYGELSTPPEVLKNWLPIAVHEFGMRGYRGMEDQIRTSSAHSLFFKGSDTLAVVDFFKNVYDADIEKDIIVNSVRASEHADISRLLSLFRHLAQKCLEEGREEFLGADPKAVLADTELFVLKWVVENSTGIMSYVADTENYYRLINVYAKQLADLIRARKPREDGQPAIFVFRPDSSRRTPLTVICGYRVYSINHMNAMEYEDDICFVDEASDEYFLKNKDGSTIRISREEAEGSLISLWNTFGGTEVETKAGLMKLIDPSVSLIYGEAISQTHQKEIYERMIEMGFSVSNLLIGKGSYASLENSTRDLFSMSYKQTFSEAIINGERVKLEQQKKPMGDVSKTSAKGLLRVEKTSEGEYILHQEQTEEQEKQGELTLLLRDGIFHKKQSYSNIISIYLS